jgi:hypothetical protein
LAARTHSLKFAPRHYAPGEVNGLIDRVHTDLYQPYEGGWHFTPGDRRRLDEAEHQLREFAKKWDYGKFDKGQLDDAICVYCFRIGGPTCPANDAVPSIPPRPIVSTADDGTITIEPFSLMAS